MKYSVRSEKKCMLAKQRNPKWRYKSHYFGIAFTSNPDKVLDYGPNGLHYLEHIMFNVINNECSFFTGNASTFDDGTMTFYFIGDEKDLLRNIIRFFRAFTSMFIPRNYKKFAKLYRTEQRRITSEVSKIHDDMETPLMFSRNPEIYRGTYPKEFIWSILYKCCKLEKVLLMTHCDISKDDEKRFFALSKDFMKVWESRYEIPVSKDPIEIPYTSIFPPSLLSPREFTLGEAIKMSREREVSLDAITDPALRLAIVSTIEPVNKARNDNPYMFRLRIQGLPEKIKPKVVDIRPEPYDEQYYWADVLLSTGEDVTSDQIEYVMTADPKDMLKKYESRVSRFVEDV